MSNRQRSAIVGELNFVTSHIARSVVDNLDIGSMSQPHAHILDSPFQLVVVIDCNGESAVNRIANPLVTIDNEVDLGAAAGHSIHHFLLLDDKSFGAKHAAETVR